MSLDLDHVLIDPLCTTFSTPEEVDEVVGQRRVADLNAHFAAVPFVRSPPPGSLAGLIVSAK
jgi:hypothetical protein